MQIHYKMRDQIEVRGIGWDEIRLDQLEAFGSIAIDGDRHTLSVFIEPDANPQHPILDCKTLREVIEAMEG